MENPVNRILLMAVPEAQLPHQFWGSRMQQVAPATPVSPSLGGDQRKEKQHGPGSCRWRRGPRDTGKTELLKRQICAGHLAGCCAFQARVLCSNFKVGKWELRDHKQGTWVTWLGHDSAGIPPWVSPRGRGMVWQNLRAPTGFTVFTSSGIAAASAVLDSLNKH